MEHRNSTIITSSTSIRVNRAGLLSTVSHEFFHSWNVERIRPKTLEPFNFDEANMSGELWLAEGFTNYYGPLMLQRAGLTPLREYTETLASAINAVTFSPGRQIRTAEEMSQMAPFVDAAAAIDRTDFDNTFISYYTWGEAIALGLDLTLRERTAGKVTLDDFMRAMWQRFGKPAGAHPGTSITRTRSLMPGRYWRRFAGDAAFADDFFTRFIQGHDVVNYAGLLADAGLLLRPQFNAVGLRRPVAPAGLALRAFASRPRYRQGRRRTKQGWIATT
jgi:predicted metalloprotease with PDZ domain